MDPRPVPEPAPARWAVRARVVVAAAIGAFIAFGPSYGQVFGGESPYLRQWHMFHRLGSQVCDVQFRDGADPRHVVLDRHAVLGRSREDAPRWLHRMENAAQVDDVAGRMCRALGPGADVRVKARCASPKGWTTTHRLDVNACTAQQTRSSNQVASDD